MTRKFALLALSALVLSACAPQQNVTRLHDPRAHIHVNQRNGEINPTLSTGVGPIRVGANRNGGVIGTKFGPISLSTGF